MQVQRAVKAQLHRLVDEVYLFIPVPQQLQKLAQHHRAVREGIQPVQHLIRRPIFRRLTPDCDVEHLQHPPLHGRQRAEVRVVQLRQQLQQEIYPVP